MTGQVPVIVNGRRDSNDARTLTQVRISLAVTIRCFSVHSLFRLRLKLMNDGSEPQLLLQ